MKTWLASAFAVSCALLAIESTVRADDSASPRIEARSASYLAVGIVHGDKMSIRLSRLADNSPVNDALVTVLLRGLAHPTVAQADGSFMLESEELKLPGSAAVEIRVLQGQAQEELKGGLLVSSGTVKPEDKNGARQLWWWVLNFAVCIGFLMLISRRRKQSAD